MKLMIVAATGGIDRHLLGDVSGSSHYPPPAFMPARSLPGTPQGVTSFMQVFRCHTGSCGSATENPQRAV
jgi:hypothetical protein